MSKGQFRVAVSAVCFAAATLVGGVAYADNLSLGWDASTDSTVSGYVVWVGTTSGNYSKTVDVGQATVYTKTDAMAGQKYFFRVLSYNADKVYSSPSPEISGFSNAPPLLTTPANQTSSVGVAAALQLTASDPYGDALTFSATGLPPGLSINRTSGAITGIPTTAGTYTVSVTATDGVLSMSGTFTWTVNGIAPNAVTLLAPLGSITTRTPVFSWTGVAGAASYQLEVRDNTGRVAISLTTTASAAGCGSGGTCTLSPNVTLATGTATWQVQTITSAGGTAWSTTGTFAVPAPPDTTAPTIAITSPATAAVTATAAALTITGTAGDNVAVSSVTWLNDRGGNGTATGTSTWSARVSLAGGVNNIIVSARDAAGNTAARTVTVTYALPDTTAPSLTITTPAASPIYVGTAATTLIGTASDASGIGNVTWTNGSFGGTAIGTTSWSAVVQLQLGINTINVTARDNAGNVTSRSVTVAYTDPAKLLGPLGSIATDVPVFTWMGSPVVTTYVLRVNDASQSGKILRTLTPTDAACANGGKCRFAPGVTLAAGAATWSVQTFVGSGSITSATASFIVPGSTEPTQPPQPSSPPPDPTPTTHKRRSSGSTDTSTGSSSIPLPDLTAPGLTVTSPATSPVYVATPTVTVVGAASDSGGIATVTWANDTKTGTAAGNTSWSALVPLQLGHNEITVTVRDIAGNATSKSLMVFYVAPATLLTPNGSSTASRPVFTWSASPAVSSYIVSVDDAVQSGKIVRTLSPADVGCSNQGTCTFAPGVALAAGVARWTVQTVLGAGAVSSAPATFRVLNSRNSVTTAITQAATPAVASSDAGTRTRVHGRRAKR